MIVKIRCSLRLDRIQTEVLRNLIIISLIKYDDDKGGLSLLGKLTEVLEKVVIQHVSNR